ncbi:zf-HC2 domain-containing protein [bacterium]|nr:zf-HC2 domain-containing protein [bacterium]RQV97929.1 MAG: zf-HC2 domain-containing protein [bacterium]
MNTIHMKKINFLMLQNDDMNQCLSSDLLQRYARRRLSKKDRIRMEDHLDVCPACLAAYEQLIILGKGQNEPDCTSDKVTAEPHTDQKVYDFLSVYQSEFTDTGNETDHSPADKRLSRSAGWILEGLFKPRRIIIAGLVSLVVLCMTYGVALIRRPAYYYLAELDPYTAFTMRSSIRPSTGFLEGLDLLTHQQYKQAIVKFEQHLAVYPDHFQAQYFVGLSHLLDATVRWLGMGYAFDHEKADSAVSALEKALMLCQENRYYVEDCRWYLGKAYLMKGDFGKAYEQFRRIAETDQPGLVRRKDAAVMMQNLEEIM